MNHGYVKSVNLERSYGFIRRDDGLDFFVHRNETEDLPWDAGLLHRRVTFDDAPGRKHSEARNVRPEET